MAVTGTTPFDSLPLLVRFDRELCAYSASTVDRILNYLAEDRLRVHQDIVYHQILGRDLRLKNDAFQHLLLNVTEFARAKPAELIELVAKKRYRYWVSRVASLQFRSTRSTWHMVNVRPDLMPSADDVPRFNDPYEHVSDLQDLWTIADPSQGEAMEGEYRRFLDNLAILFRRCDWADQKLFACFYFDVYGFLQEERKKKPKAVMTYRLLARYTGIPFRAIHAAVHRVHQFIRDEYESTFGTPIPQHLLKKLFQN